MYLLIKLYVTSFFFYWIAFSNFISTLGLTHKHKLFISYKEKERDRKREYVIIA